MRNHQDDIPTKRITQCGRPVAALFLAVLFSFLLASPSVGQGQKDLDVAHVSRAGNASIAVIVSASWEGAHWITIGDLRRIFLARISSWDGARVRPIQPRSGSAVQEAFLRKALDMSPDQYERYWLEQKLRAGGRPPRKSHSFGGLVAYVGRVDGAIGYVDAAKLARTRPEGVKVLEIELDGRRSHPHDAGYPLTTANVER